jgi:Flp pilus assembly protein TadG
VAFRRHFRRDDCGAAAIEFAFVAPMVIVLVIATIEVGIMEIMSSNLDAAVMVAARKIRTGAADRPTTSAAFADMICANMVDSSANCHSRLATSVQKTTDFATATTLAAVKPSGQYDAGGPGDVILIEATYSWPLILPMYAGNFQLAGPSQALVDARATFRNEPYQ